MKEPNAKSEQNNRGIMNLGRVRAFALTPEKVQVATFFLQLAILAVVVLHLFAAWQYKGRWQNLTARVGRLESVLSQAHEETAKPKQQQ